MSDRQLFAERMRANLDDIGAELKRLEQAAERAESGLEAEYFTRLESLRLDLQTAEQKFELFLETHDEAWETFKADLEASWTSMRELIKGITAP